MPQKSMLAASECNKVFFANKNLYGTLKSSLHGNPSQVDELLGMRGALRRGEAED